MKQIQFTKVRDGFYLSDDNLYSIVYAYDCWNVICRCDVITATNKLSDAKKIVQAIRTLLFFEVKLDKCI